MVLTIDQRQVGNVVREDLDDLRVVRAALRRTAWFRADSDEQLVDVGVAVAGTVGRRDRLDRVARVKARNPISGSPLRRLIHIHVEVALDENLSCITARSSGMRCGRRWPSTAAE